MFMCSFKDPGRIPKNYNQNSRLKDIPPFGDRVENSNRIEYYSKKEIKFPQYNYYIKIKYCITCNVY